MVQRTYMPSFRVETPQRAYEAIVERGALARVAESLPSRAGLVFVVTTTDVFKLHGKNLHQAIAGHKHKVLFFPAASPTSAFLNWRLWQSRWSQQAGTGRASS